jgi:hypothetical protein
VGELLSNAGPYFLLFRICSNGEKRSVSIKIKKEVQLPAQYIEAVKLGLAMLMAFAALFFTSRQQTDLQNLAMGEQNTSRIESDHGVPYTACTVKDIKMLLESRAGTGQQFKRILWLGNSQLHYINQYREGDHLAPYWLRQAWQGPCRLEPLGCSIPNADLQEYLVLSRFAAMRFPVHMLIVELVFDDLREDGLRDDFSEILSPATITELKKSSKTTEIILQRYLSTGDSGEGGKDVLAGTIQRPVERWLNNRISSLCNLWADRPQIEGKFLVALYYFRNWALGIKPTSTRKMIRARYDLNMDALHDMLAYCHNRGIPVLLYIAPIRQDKHIPYDRSEYNQWKEEVNIIAAQSGALLINLERLVPGNLWGSYTGDDIDFMHFQGAGHRLVAEALLPHAEEALEKEKP